MRREQKAVWAGAALLCALLLSAGCGSKDGGGAAPNASTSEVQAQAQKRAADQANMAQQRGAAGKQ